MAARDLHIFLVLSLALSLSLYPSRCHLWSALSPNVGRIVCVTTSVGSSVAHFVADALVTHRLEKVLLSHTGFRRRVSL